MMTLDTKHFAIQQIVSSSGGALITALLMTPLDVIKIRLQSQQRQLHKGDCFVYRNGLMDHLCKCFDNNGSWYNRKIPGGRYTGTFDALVKIVRAEGLTSLWSGLPPTLAMAVPMTVLYFSTYEEIKRLLNYDSVRNPNPVLPVISGAFARFLAVTFVSPVEMIRTKMQSEKLKYAEVNHALRFSIENYGFKSLYRGLVPTLLRDVPFSMIYWLSYESSKTFFMKHRNQNKIDTPTAFFCGATSGALSATITCPLDVVKTFRQIQLGELEGDKRPRKTLDIIIDIYKQKGVRGLYAGLLPRVIKVSSSCGIMISCFEYFKTFFNGLENK
jgi:solute carrier family 25 protein 39/40